VTRQSRHHRRQAKLIALTGTPGTGKKSIAPLLCKLLGVEPIGLAELASSISTGSASGELEVSSSKLRRKLLADSPSSALVFGHMVPDVLRRGEVEFAAVLRCEPSELKKRLAARGYSDDKVTENVEAELIGVLLDSSLRAFGEAVVHEYDTTGLAPASVARRIARDYRGARAHNDQKQFIDWTFRYDSSTRLRSLLSAPARGPAST